MKIAQTRKAIIADGLSREYGTEAAIQIRNPRVQTIGMQNAANCLAAFGLNMAEELNLEGGTLVQIARTKKAIIADGLSREYGAGAALQIRNPRVQTVGMQNAANCLAAFGLNMAEELNLEGGTLVQIAQTKKAIIADGLFREYSGGAALQIRNPRVQTIGMQNAANCLAAFGLNMAEELNLEGGTLVQIAQTKKAISNDGLSRKYGGGAGIGTLGGL